MRHQGGGTVNDYDVIVAGGGPAGIGAAVSSSVNGAKTLLLEGRSFFGGIAGTSLFMPMNRLKLQGGKRGGVHDLLIEELEKFNGLACREGKVTWTDGDGLHVHPDYLKMALFNLLDRVGCDYRLYSPVVGAGKEGNTLRRINVYRKDGNECFSAEVFIDCTGDGDLSFYAGADFEIGRENDGALMPVTLGFSLANVDTDRLFSWYDSDRSAGDMKKILEEAEQAGYTTSAWYSFDRTTIPNIASVNNGGLKSIGTINILDPADATKTEKAGIRLALDFVEIAKKYRIPGLENCALDRTGAAVGARESRRILCDYVVSEKDAYEGTEFPDVVARRYGAIDQAGLTEQMDAEIKMKSGYGFPYRALLVRGIEGLLVAGKCGSYTHLGLAAGKSMGNMMAIGQAAGTAAALSVKSGCTPRELQAEVVQEALGRMGVMLQEFEGGT